MTAITLGIPLDPRIQVGFYGTDREVFQQLHEREEEYLLSRRWFSSPLLEIPSFRNETLVSYCKKKHEFCLLGFEIQTVGANSDSQLRIVDEE
jgi:hypothetical protein